MSTDSKLSPHIVWLFAAAALAVAIGATYAVHATSWKVYAGIYFVLFGGGAFAAGMLTRASAVQTILPFAAASAGLGAFYYAVFAKVASAAGDSFGSSAGGAASKLALVIGAVVFIDALAASIGGAVSGMKLRNVKSFGDLVPKR